MSYNQLWDDWRVLPKWHGIEAHVKSLNDRYFFSIGDSNTDHQAGSG
jgi:hypothetical protein